MNFMSLLNLKTKIEPKYFNKAAEEILNLAKLANTYLNDKDCM